MNTKKALDKIFVSRVRIKLLHYFFMHPSEPLHLRGAVREIKEEINAVRRELIRMEEVKMVRADVHGNRKYYFLSQDAPFYDELRGMVYKTFGLGGDFVRNLPKMGSIHLAILGGNYLTGRKSTDHPVDLLVVGEVNVDELTKLVSEFEQKNNIEINYAVLSENDFELRRKRKDQFLYQVLVSPKLILVGNQDMLVI